MNWIKLKVILQNNLFSVTQTDLATLQLNYFVKTLCKTSVSYFFSSVVTHGPLKCYFPHALKKIEMSEGLSNVLNPLGISQRYWVSAWLERSHTHPLHIGHSCQHFTLHLQDGGQSLGPCGWRRNTRWHSSHDHTVLSFVSLIMQKHVSIAHARQIQIIFISLYLADVSSPVL